jgi:hypothetical protein
MSYEFLTDWELIREVSAVANEISAISTQAEKLFELKEKENVPSGIYGEIVNDLDSKIRIWRQRTDALLEVAKVRARDVGEEVSRLRSQIELLEIRHAIGVISDEKYKKVGEDAMKKLQQSEKIVKEMEGLIALMQNCMASLDRYDSKEGSIAPREVKLEVQKDLKEKPASPPQPAIIQKIEKETSKQQQAERRCPRCGTICNPIAKFCSVCGTRFSDS